MSNVRYRDGDVIFYNTEGVIWVKTILEPVLAIIIEALADRYSATALIEQFYHRNLVSQFGSKHLIGQFQTEKLKDQFQFSDHGVLD